MTQLTELWADDNQIADLTALSGLTNLQTLALDDNQVTTLTPLVNNPGLGAGDYAFLYDNPLNCSTEAANILALTSRQLGLVTDCK